MLCCRTDCAGGAHAMMRSVSSECKSKGWAWSKRLVVCGLVGFFLVSWAFVRWSFFFFPSFIIKH